MRFLRFFLIPITLLMIAGCMGGSNMGGDAPKIATPPPIEEATRIAIAPFIVAPKAQQLGHRVPFNLGTNFGMVLKDTEWIYDQSKSLNPVASKLKELNLTLQNIYNDSALAAKVGQALSADLIVVGQIGAPKLKKNDYNQVFKKEGRQAGISGSSTYLRSRQTATIKSWIKVIDTKTGELVFNDAVNDYIKYWFAYQTEMRNNVIFKTEEEILADLGKHLTARIAYSLYPTGMREVKEGDVLLTPDVELKGTGGLVSFD